MKGWYLAEISSLIAYMVQVGLLPLGTDSIDPAAWRARGGER